MGSESRHSPAIHTRQRLVFDMSSTPAGGLGRRAGILNELLPIENGQCRIHTCSFRQLPGTDGLAERC